MRLWDCNKSSNSPLHSPLLPVLIFSSCRCISGASLPSPSPKPWNLHPPSHLHFVALVVTDWVKNEQGGTNEQARKLVGAFSAEYLVSLSRPTRVHWPKQPQGSNYRHLWRQIAANKFGWVARRGEGELGGFSNFVNEALRSQIFPDCFASSDVTTTSCCEKEE